MVNLTLQLTVTLSLISMSHGLFERWYMVPPLGTTKVLDVENNRSIVLTIVDQPASIKVETQIPDVLEGYLIVANPPNACRKLNPPPEYPGDDETANHTEEPVSVPKDWILLVDKTYCSYAVKVQYAQLAGYAGLLVHNVGSNKTEVIGYNEEHFDLLIPTYFLGEYDGELLRHNFAYHTNKSRNHYIIRIESEPSFYLDIVLYLVWTFFALLIFVVVICGLKPCYYCLIQPWWNSRQERRKRKLMIEAVAALPIIEWKHADKEKFEICVICLESYILGDLVRILRCSHGFHMACIDAWLLKVRRNCPSCKTNLMSSRCWTEFSDSDISEGNYVTDIAHEPASDSSSRNAMLQDSNELEIDAVIRSILSRRTLNEMSWSSSSSSTLTSNYSTAPSTTGESPPSTISCMAVVHAGGSITTGANDIEINANQDGYS